MQWRPAAFYQSRRESAFAFQGDERVKIIVVEPYTRTPGHHERLPVRTCEAFANLGHEVTLVTYGGLSSNWFQTRLPFQVVDAAPPGATDLDARYYKGKIDIKSYRSLAKRMIREYRTFRFAASLIRRDHFAVVHFYDADLLVLALAMKLFKGFRKNTSPVIVLTVHHVLTLAPSQPEYPPGMSLSRKIRRKIYRSALRYVAGRLIQYNLDGIVVLDPSLKKAILSRFGTDQAVADRIRVVPHGIGDPVEVVSKEQARARLKLPPGETLFLVFGVLRKDKRIDLAIEAIRDLPRCRLVIAGAAQDIDESTIFELTRRYGCEEQVFTEIDHIPEQKMHDYFSACDAVIIPYDDSFQGLSGILTLACGHGRPVIASDVSLLGETVRQRQLGFAVEPGSALGLREAMLRFLSLTPEERAQMEQRVESYARQMSWDSVCEKWVDFYQELLERRKKLCCT